MTRKIHIDLLRILAICLVVFNHTGVNGYFLFIKHTDSVLYMPYMLASIFCKIAVPIFFMISGALLLKKEETILQVFKKRIFRIAVVLIIGSVPYYVWLCRDGAFGVLDFFSTIYQTETTTSYWYLYSYLGVLFMLPLLQKLAKAMTNHEFIYVICGYIVLTGILPSLELLISGARSSLNPSFSVAILTASNIVYVLTGYFLENRVSEEYFTSKNMVMSGIASIAFMVITYFLTKENISIIGTEDLNKVEGYFNTFIIVPAFSVFFIFKGVFLKVKTGEKTGKVITTLGASVFGVYLIEKVLRAATSPVYNILNPYIGSFFASVIWVLVVVSVGLSAITGLKNIPYIKRIVNKFI